MIKSVAVVGTGYYKDTGEWHVVSLRRKKKFIRCDRRIRKKKKEKLTQRKGRKFLKLYFFRTKNL